MKRYIREKLKFDLAFSFLVVATITLISTNELIAKVLPDVSTVDISCVNFAGGEEFEHTGQEIMPELEFILYSKENEATTNTLRAEDIEITYVNNVEVGYADVELKLAGFKGSVLVEDVFTINPAAVSDIEVAQAEDKSLLLTWTKVVSADGYVIYRKSNEEIEFVEYYEVNNGNVTEFNDVDVRNNACYEYGVAAYVDIDGQRLFGAVSYSEVFVTELERASILEVESKSYDSLKVIWEQIDGSSGYELYRSDSKNGKYTCIATFDDGKVTSYTDKKRECGKTYFYYIKTKQTVSDIVRLGQASEVVSGKTKPNTSNISGSVNSDCTDVTITWTEAAGATGYELYKSVGNTSNYQLVKKFGQNDERTYSETGLSKDSSVYYRVRAFREYNGETIFGSYSSSFQKQVKVNMNYSSGSGSLGGVTQYVGTPYVYGGTTPNGWDCSGFTKWALATFCGKTIPSGSIAQGKNGTAVPMNDRSQWQTGDILVYSNGSRISHVALYLGDGQLMHALSTKHSTIIQGVDYYESWDSGTYLIGVRRY